MLSEKLSKKKKKRELAKDIKKKSICWRSAHRRRERKQRMKEGGERSKKKKEVIPSSHIRHDLLPKGKNRGSRWPETGKNSPLRPWESCENPKRLARANGDTQPALRKDNDRFERTNTNPKKKKTQEQCGGFLI